MPEDVTFKDPADYRYIGKPMDLVDGVAMTTGTGMYGTDTVLPGMLYASIERCPVFGGTVKSMDDAKALKVAGVKQVIKMPEVTSPPGYNPLGGVAVLASNTWSAEQGRKALAVEWDTGLNAEYDSAGYREQLVETSSTVGTTVMHRGDVNAAVETAGRVIEAVYYAPHLSHAPMEPPAATVAKRMYGFIYMTCTRVPFGSSAIRTSRRSDRERRTASCCPSGQQTITKALILPPGSTWST